MSEIRRLSAEETERIRRTPGHSGHSICGIVIGSSWHEPVACAYPPDHTGDHSWASIPQFDPRRDETHDRSLENWHRAEVAEAQLRDANEKWVEWQQHALAAEARAEALREALCVAGRHLEDCCRTDIDLGEQMDTHNDAVNAVHRAEQVSNPASEDEAWEKRSHER